MIFFPSHAVGDSVIFASAIGWRDLGPQRHHGRIIVFTVIMGFFGVLILTIGVFSEIPSPLFANICVSYSCVAHRQGVVDLNAINVSGCEVVVVGSQWKMSFLKATGMEIDLVVIRMMVGARRAYLWGASSTTLRL